MKLVPQFPSIYTASLPRMFTFFLLQIGIMSNREPGERTLLYSDYSFNFCGFFCFFFSRKSTVFQLLFIFQIFISIVTCEMLYIIVSLTPFSHLHSLPSLPYNFLQDFQALNLSLPGQSSIRWSNTLYTGKIQVRALLEIRGLGGSVVEQKLCTPLSL